MTTEKKPVPVVHPLVPIRKAAVPLVQITSADPAATVQGCIAALNGKAESTAIVQWDIALGWKGLNDKGKDSLNWYDPLAQQVPETLPLLGDNMPAKSLVFMHNVQRIIDRDGIVQGLWNLRDVFKSNGCTLVLVGPIFALPVELAGDVVVVNEALPDAVAIGEIVDGIVKDSKAAGAKIAEDYGREKAVETLRGLSAFAAQQAMALSVSKSGVDLPGLWERKVQVISQTPGLSVWTGKDSFADIGGCDNVKTFLGDVLRGRNAPLAIAFVDEIEKSLAGAAGDSSGVSQDCLGAILTFMQDKDATGMIFVGPPGAAKSAVAKAAGNEVGIPTIVTDLGAMKGSLVGQSEQRLRQALSVIDAVSQSRTLFIATCNSLGVLPPELKRRFTLGTFFFELPTAEERAAIWQIYRKKFQIDEADLPPDDTEWTGAEIRQCANIAWRLKKSLRYASTFVVPVAKAAADKIKQLRMQASGKFISASKPGLYSWSGESKGPVGRAIEL